MAERNGSWPLGRKWSRSGTPGFLCRDDLEWDRVLLLFRGAEGIPGAAGLNRAGAAAGERGDVARGAPVSGT